MQQPRCREAYGAVQALLCTGSCSLQILKAISLDCYFLSLNCPSALLSFIPAKRVHEHRLQVWFLPATGTDAAVMHKLWNG